MIFYGPYHDGLAGSDDVAMMQKALRDWSVSKNLPAADPGPIDGIVGSRTLTALAAVMGSIPKFPAAVKSIISMAIAAGTFKPDLLKPAFQAVTDAAKIIALAIRGGMLLVGGGGTSPIKYPSGTIYYFDAELGMFRVAIPMGTSLSGYSGLGMATHQEVDPSVAEPSGAIRTNKGEFLTATGKTPWYKQPLAIVGLVAGGLAVVGTGAYVIMRRK